jgi:hypothetical protein
VSDLAVLAIPSAAAAGLVLVALGLGGTARTARRERAGRARDWLAQAGYAGYGRGRWWRCAARSAEPRGWACWP